MKVVLSVLPQKERFMVEGRCQQKSSSYSDSIIPPITLAYLAAILKEKSEIEVIDANSEEMKLDLFLEKIESLKPDFLFVSSSTPTINNDLKTLEKVKEKNIETKIVLFGVHATYDAKNLVKNKCVDFVIKNDPEFVALNLISKPISEVNGITYEKNGLIVDKPNEIPTDLNKLPFPDWSKFNLEKYKLPIKGKKYLLIMPVRGCPFNCEFCVAPYYYGKIPRFRSFENVLEEIAFMKKEHNINEFFFYAETFTIRKDFVEKLCDGINSRRLNISWMSNTRADCIDEKLAIKMKKSGCWLTSIGIESSSQEILNKARKGIRIEQIVRAVHALNNARILVLGHFIFGLEGETKNTIKNTIEFSKKIGLDFAKYYIATPYPGSNLFEKYKDRIKNWEECEYSVNLISPELNLEEWRQKAFKEFYLRPSQIIKIFSKFGIKNIPTMISNAIGFMKSW